MAFLVLIAIFAALGISLLLALESLVFSGCTVLFVFTIKFLLVEFTWAFGEIPTPVKNNITDNTPTINAFLSLDFIPLNKMALGTLQIAKI
ncbi:MAG TPA: hypothetical protein VIM70_10665 [Clostridium sp.]|uniref:hypothetical protein n=1 Tax=Clostridium sp. TaxID=1506 RepID=UPI002F93D41A